MSHYQDTIIKACGKGDYDVVDFFLKRGEVIPPETFIAAAKYGQKNIVELLLNIGLNPNKKVWGSYPLIEATMKCHTEIVKLLVENKADVNVKNNFANTNSLQFTCSHCRDFEIIKILIKNKADPNHMGAWGYSAFHIICQKERTKYTLKLFLTGYDIV